MKKAHEYREHAHECRSLAGKAQTEDQRSQLLNMAATWDALAESRERIVRESQTLHEFECLREMATPIVRM